MCKNNHMVNDKLRSRSHDTEPKCDHITMKEGWKQHSNPPKDSRTSIPWHILSLLRTKKNTKTVIAKQIEIVLYMMTRFFVSGFNSTMCAGLFVKLMKRLGHDRFYTQGGDWGAAITSAIAVLHSR